MRVQTPSSSCRATAVTAFASCRAFLWLWWCAHRLFRGFSVRSTPVLRQAATCVLVCCLSCLRPLGDDDGVAGRHPSSPSLALRPAHLLSSPPSFTPSRPSSSLSFFCAQRARRHRAHARVLCDPASHSDRHRGPCHDVCVEVCILRLRRTTLVRAGALQRRDRSEAHAHVLRSVLCFFLRLSLSELPWPRIANQYDNLSFHQE